MSQSSYTVVRANRLTRKLKRQAAITAALSTFALIVAGLSYWGDSWGAEKWMAASHDLVFKQHEWWRAWSTLFVHADFRHLLSNSLLFFILGSFVNGYFGWWAFPVIAFVVGGLTNIYVLAQMPGPILLIGVSGVVFWLGGFWLILYFLIDRRKTLLQRALRASGVGLALFMPAEAFDPSISYTTHLVGFFLGIICGLGFYLVNRRKIEREEIRETIFESDDDELSNQDQGPL